MNLNKGWVDIVDNATFEEWTLELNAFKNFKGRP